MSLDRLGLLKTSLIDYPEEVASVLFTAGCNLRCPYCHNPELVTRPIPPEFLPVDDVLSHLVKRRKVLGGVCITGGEPLLHSDLPELIGEIKKIGLKVKLDTNGMLPERLELLPVDYIAMDIKTSPGRYGLLGSEASGDSVLRSVDYLRRSRVPHHFRITLVPGIVTREDLEEIAGLLSVDDVVTVSQFRPGTTLDPVYRTVSPYTETAAMGLLSCLRERSITVKMLGFNS